MQRRAFLAMLAACAATPAFALLPLPTDPLPIVERIYKLAAGKSGKYDGPSMIDNKEVRERYLSKSLDTLVRKAYAKSRRINEPIIDFDPVLNTQDPSPPEGLKVEVASASDTKATVVASWKIGGTGYAVAYDFVRESGAWKVFDLRGGEGQDAWSLRKIAAGG